MEKQDSLFLKLWLSIIILSISLNYYSKEIATEAINPLFNDFIKYSEKEKMEFNFKTKLTRGWKINPNDLNIFKDRNEIYDILLIGDSSVNYGIYITLLEFLTQKKIGAITFPALTVTNELFETILQIASHKLKQDGLILFMFDPKFWNKGFYLKQENQELNELINSYKYENRCLFCKSSLNKYTSEISFESYFNRVLNEPKLHKYGFYNNYIEPLINPKKFKQKQINKIKKKENEDRFFLDSTSVLIVKKNSNKNYQPGNLIFDEEKYTFKSEVEVFFKKIKQKIIIVIPIVENQDIYFMLKRITNALKNTTIDLPQKANNLSIDMQNRTHTANLGIIIQTNLLAKELNEIVH